MRIEKVTITPGLAIEWLKKNTKNRRINTSRVAMMVHDIMLGKWTSDSPTPICFTPEGTLLDGQHRLKAIVTANIPVEMFVAYDVPPEVVIDRGQERNSYQELYIRGEIEKEFTSSAVQRLINGCLGRENMGNVFSDSTKQKFINDNKETIRNVIRIASPNNVRVGGGGVNYCRNQPVLCAFFYALKQGVSEDILRKFKYVLNTGFMENPNQSAAVVCRNYLIDEKGKTGANHTNERMMVTEMAIRDFVNKVPRQNRYTKLTHVYFIKPV